MAQADFDFTTDSILPVGGPQGAAVLHSSLPAPVLVGEGLWCRRFQAASNGETFVRAVVNKPEYVGVPNTKAVSLRAWLRAGGSRTDSIVGLVGRTIRSSTAHSGASNDAVWGGYSLVVRNTGFSSVNVRIVARNNVGSGQTQVSENNSLAGTGWRRFRFDIIPLLDGNDVLRSYIMTSGSTGSEEWELLHDVTIPAGHPHYSPPAPDTGYGFFACCWSANNEISAIDRFQMFTEGV